MTSPGRYFRLCGFICDGGTKNPGKSGTLEEIQFENASIDIVTMWHFWEHTSNPVDYLTQAALWLRPDGLWVIDVPNYEGTAAQKTWNEWVGWQIPYHFFHFTSKTLIDLLFACGFIAIRKKDYHSEYIKIHLKGVPGISLFASLIAKGFSGTSFAAMARKWIS
jgi:SAM-dependent methyltransferase